MSSKDCLCVGTARDFHWKLAFFAGARAGEVRHLNLRSLSFPFEIWNFGFP